jgi:hypothetical protein
MYTTLAHLPLPVKGRLPGVSPFFILIGSQTPAVVATSSSYVQKVDSTNPQKGLSMTPFRSAAACGELVCSVFDPEV